MQKLFKLLSQSWILTFLVILAIPSFFRMMGYGMFSTQDFHLFRLHQFDKCVQNLEIPCRWAPDAGLGYGEPLFNFYGQFAYTVGEVYHLLGGSFVDSIKFIFIISLLGSSVSMFFLARRLWKSNLAAMVSAVLYLYAPYRALDVWVRGALPEAFAFIFFPLILLAIETKSVKWLSALIALLVITHNLSFVMFSPLIIVWLTYRKFWKGLWSFLVAGFLASFYILPVVFESKFIDLESTIRGYFDFHNHFTTLNQLFMSNFWGYGASNWGLGDGLSLAIGYLQWGAPLFGLLIMIYQYIISKDRKILRKNFSFVILVVLGFGFVFLTHNKSTSIWEVLTFMKYIQFPWRFLGIAVFCFALASGGLLILLGKLKWIFAVTVIILTISLNAQFFRPDIWYTVGDDYYFTGTEWDRQRTASIGDFWPDFGHKIPEKPTDGSFVNYFPGWVSEQPPNGGLIPAKGAKFTDTPVRRVANVLSLASLLGFGLYSLYSKKWTKNI